MTVASRLQKKLDRGDYSHPREFKHDVGLVWSNCMTYNADGSEYYNLASNLRKMFEDKYSKTIKEDGGCPRKLYKLYMLACWRVT